MCQKKMLVSFFDLKPFVEQIWVLEFFFSFSFLKVEHEIRTVFENGLPVFRGLELKEEY